MSVAELITLTLKFSLALGIFAVGLKATLDDAVFLFRRPERLVNALVAMYVAMPLIAVCVALAFDLSPAVKIALVALSVAPIPPILPHKALKAGGRECYAVGLLVAGSLLSILLIPFAMELFQVVFGIPLRMTASAIALLVLMSVLVPFAAGMAVRAIIPSFAERLAQPASAVSTVLLIAGFLPLLFSQGGQLFSLLGGGSLAALAVFAVAGLLVGHALGGPHFEDRTVLALYTSARHPGVAVAIAHTNFPQQRAALAAIVLAMLIGAILSAPYLTWTKRHKPGRPAATGLGR